MPSNNPSKMSKLPFTTRDLPGHNPNACRQVALRFSDFAELLYHFQLPPLPVTATDRAERKPRAPWTRAADRYWCEITEMTVSVQACSALRAVPPL